METFDENKAFWISIAILYTSMIALIFIQIGFAQGKKAGELQAEQLQQAQTATVDEQSLDQLPPIPNPALSPTPEPYKYIVKRYGDKIAVFEGDKLIRILDDVNFHTLRKEDRTLLENGIGAYTQEELAEILENYVS